MKFSQFRRQLNRETGDDLTSIIYTAPHDHIIVVSHCTVKTITVVDTTHLVNLTFYNGEEAQFSFDQVENDLNFSLYFLII